MRNTMAERILVVDDEPNITRAFCSLLTDEGYEATTVASAEEAQRAADARHYDLVLLDLNLPGKSGIEFLRDRKDRPLSVAVLVISGQSDIGTALEAVKLGALDYLEKPVQPEKLLASVRASLMLAAAKRQRALILEEVDRDSEIIGRSPATRRFVAALDRVAPFDATVLITGENGTGKELAATRLYLASSRREKPFVKVNCPGIPETLFESELFGHLKGAFTGAVKDYPGKFMLADGGTIFLDEIGELPVPCQAKLLRVLEGGEMQRLGDPNRSRVDVRIICATNRDLCQLVKEGRFREDLYYRISVIQIETPPLRDRREDIPLLVGEFAKRFDPAGSVTFSTDAVASLAALDYPGNVRQLRNLIERLTIVCQGRTVESDDILADPTLTREEPEHEDVPGLAERLEIFEKQIIRQSLDRAGGNITEAARFLKMDRSRLSRRIKEFGLK
jgi:DNA-binding NtrC family response regulator